MFFSSRKDAEGQISTSSPGHGDAKALEKYLHDLIDGGLTTPAPTIRSPELQNLTRLIAPFEDLRLTLRAWGLALIGNYLPIP